MIWVVYMEGVFGIIDKDLFLGLIVVIRVLFYMNLLSYTFVWFFLIVLFYNKNYKKIEEGYFYRVRVLSSYWGIVLGVGVFKGRVKVFLLEYG